ncbi:hypothetical protein CNMCM8812_006497 [Aspergillus fumigatus]|nr:hypothetical protein CNMCM8714_008091 [Aspergillus fumigatus]KMK55126.1 hypothetical protein Y699_07231 [Aspergillus fumigatus Z5]KAF4273979.1 hypothetical protein CNMCM8812_006497 [Aspergillus fumigatus]KAH1290853.1 hypothetical protein KXX11_000499 [Aspergillus fumigatus]KAH1514799.1 hypothetical protein KXX29_000775 [Aspergillus fumigatus]
MKPAHLSNSLVFLILPALGYAAPASATTQHQARDVKITATQIETIAPKSKSCADAPAPGECATSEQAAANIAKSFETYKVTSAAEQAAVIGLMAFESLDFEYNRNHFPGVAGQGTRNMQSPAFNAKYAASLPALADKLKDVSGDPAGVLDLLLSNEEYDFGSGAWFLTTQCSQDVRSELQSGSQGGWEKYINSCVGTDANEERKAYWMRAVQALGA